jgi:excisionase family DNA binding protein
MGTGGREGPEVRRASEAGGVIETRPLMTFDDVAVRLNLKKRTIEGYAQQGVLPYLRIGRHVRFEPAAIDEFIRTRREAA